MVLVNDEISRREVREGLQLFTVRGCFFGLRLAFRLFDEQLSLGQDGKPQVRIFQTCRQRPVRQENLPCLRQMDRRERKKGVHALFSEHLLENFAPPPAAAQNEAAVVVSHIAFKIADCRLQTSAVARQLPGCDRQKLLGR